MRAIGIGRQMLANGLQTRYQIMPGDATKAIGTMLQILQIGHQTKLFGARTTFQTTQGIKAIGYMHQILQIGHPTTSFNAYQCHN